MPIDHRVIINFFVILGLLVVDACTEKSSEQAPDLHGNPNEVGTSVSSASEIIEPRTQARAGEATCGYENNASSLGIGLVLAPPVLTLWTDSAATVKYLSVSTSTDEGLTDICPKFYEPEYGIIHFVCLASSAVTYMVLADSSTVRYITKSTDGIEFTSWDEYILQSFGVRRKIGEEGNPKISALLRSEPEDNAPSLEIPRGHEMFCPMEVEGDWVKVRYDCFYNREPSPHEGEPCHNFIDQCANPVTGWLRWREGNDLLIDIFLMP